MKKVWLTVGVLTAMALPATAVALSSSDFKNAAKYCKAVRAELSVTTFKQTYGTNKHKSNAYAKCVSKQARVEHANHSNAVSDCRDERSQDATAFNQNYGSGHNGANAFGKCVSQKSKAASKDEQEATVNAARACRTERSQGAKAFKDNYGTNRNKSNAFGKCVSQKAKELQAPATLP
jgi:hypothetical protein